MVEKFNPNFCPGEVMAEIAQGYRNAVARKDIHHLEARKKCDLAMRQLKILNLAEPTIPFETDSTQFEELLKEAQRLKTQPY